jgi:hypothetical protein
MVIMGARLVATGITVLALCACGQNRQLTAPTATAAATTPATPPVRLAITAERDRILSTESVQFSARAIFADGAELLVKPVWVVDDPTVAVVNEKGIVTGVGAGTALVVAVSQGLSAAFPVRVDPDFQGVWAGRAVNIGGRCNDFRRCGFGSSRAITVNIALSGGIATATLEDEGYRAPLAGSVSNDGLLMLSGRFRETVSGNPIQGSDVIGWRTRIDKTGTLTGEYSLAAEAEFSPFIGVYQLQKVTKVGALTSPSPSSPTPTPTPAPGPPASLSYLTMSPDLSTLLIGRNQTLSANGVFADGTARTVAASWSVDNSQVATITEQGVIKARRLGAVTVTASAAGLSVTRRLTTLNDLAGWWEGNAVVRSCSSRLADSCSRVPAGTTAGVSLFVDQQGRRIHALADMLLTPGRYQVWTDGSVSDDGTMTFAGEWRLQQTFGFIVRKIADWKSSIRDDGTMAGTFTAFAQENYSAEATLQINLDLVSMRHTRVVPNRVP